MMSQTRKVAVKTFKSLLVQVKFGSRKQFRVTVEVEARIRLVEA